MTKDVNTSLGSWARHWVILTDGRIACAACDGAQLASNAYDLFVHDFHCCRDVRADKLPWISLSNCLGKLSDTGLS
jgi:hypothetical protein